MDTKHFSKFVILAVLLIGLMVTPALADGENNINGKTGVGYQGMVIGDFLNGISVRNWSLGNIGFEGNFFYGGVDIDVDDEDTFDGDLYLFEAKAMYAFIIKENSRFYAGGKFGYGYFDVDILSENVDGDLYSLAAFVGAEWNFQGIPELGFNFDVGYSYNWYDDEIDDTDIEIEMDGISATFGIHYYF